MLRIVKLLRSEVSAEVGGTLNFASRVSTILHSGIAAASLGEAKLHQPLKITTICGIITAFAVIIPVYRHFPPRLAPGTGKYGYIIPLRFASWYNNCKSSNYQTAEEPYFKFAVTPRLPCAKGAVSEAD